MGEREKGKGNVHEDAAAEVVVGLLDDAVDDHLFDIEHGEHGRGEGEHDGLRELCAWACAVRGRRGGLGEDGNKVSLRVAGEQIPHNNATHQRP